MNTALDALLKAQPALWRGRDQYNDYDSIPTGFEQLNRALPSNGWGIGCLTELLLEQRAIGELSLLLPALSQVTAEQQWAAFINPPYLPYAPALANANINLERLLIIDSDNDTDTLWAAEQVLRAGIFAAVVCWVKKTTPQKQRRLQLAAEIGKTWAVMYRPASACKEHSPAALRIVLSTDSSANSQANSQVNSQVSNQANRQINNQGLSLDIIKSRGGQPQSLVINPSDFDQSQGAEWPATNLLAESAPCSVRSIAMLNPVQV